MIVNEDAFEARNLTKAGYDVNPLTDGSLEGYSVYEVPMSSLTLRAVEPLGVKPRDAERSKNFFALGLVSWMYTRPVDETLRWIEAKFANKPQVRDANVAAFKAGHAFGETAELFDHPYEVDPAALPPGTYTNINGNTALAWGLVAASAALGAAAVPRLVPDHPGLGHPPRALQAQGASACARCRPRTRSPGSARPSGPRTAGTSPSPPRAARAWPSRRRRWAWR